MESSSSATEGVKLEYVSVPDIDNCIGEEVIISDKSGEDSEHQQQQQHQHQHQHHHDLEGGVSQVDFCSSDDVAVQEETVVTTESHHEESSNSQAIYFTNDGHQQLYHHEQEQSIPGEVPGEVTQYYEEAYIADPGDVGAETILSDSGQVIEESILSRSSQNPDIQTAIDLAKFSEQAKTSSSNSTPQRYIILQYPNGSSHKIANNSTNNSPIYIRKSPLKSTTHNVLNGSGGSGVNLVGNMETSSNYRPSYSRHSLDPSGKPKMSYSAMISEVIKAAPDQRLTLSEIYQNISNRYPYYKMDCKNWQNSIRHNLSLNHSFVKVPRPENKGRGHYWTIDPSKEKPFRRHSTGGTMMSASKQIIQSNRATTTYQIVTLPPGATIN